MKFWVSSEADLGEEKLLKILLVIWVNGGVFHRCSHGRKNLDGGYCWFRWVAVFWPVLVFVCVCCCFGFWEGIGFNCLIGEMVMGDKLVKDGDSHCSHCILLCFIVVLLLRLVVGG